MDVGLSGAVHFHLSGAGAAAHADILERSAEAGSLMALEMREGDEIIGVHDGASDFGLLDVIAALHRDERLVCALESVCDDDMAAGGEGVIPVHISGIEVVECVLASADIEGIAVGEEGLAAVLLHDIDDDLGVIRAQVREVAGLAEMDLDGGIAVGEIKGIDSGALDEETELLEEISLRGCVEVSEINLGFFHFQ